jgi:excisionase family DNA binding protein
VPQVLPNRPTMTAAEVAAVLNVSRDVIYDAARRKELPSVKIGRTMRFPTAKIAELLGLENGH